MELELNYNMIYSFKCGQMNIINGKVVPDTRKGKVMIYINYDQLLCWQWVSEDQSFKTEPLVIFTEEWDWIKIKTGKGRVYQLKSRNFEDSFLYWLIEADNSLESKINDDILIILKDGKLNSSEKNKINVNENNNSETNTNVNATLSNTNSNNNTNTNSNSNNTNSNQNNSVSNKDWINNLSNLLNQTKSKKKFKIRKKYFTKKDFD